MKNQTKEQDVLQDLLRKAYFEKEALRVGDQWQQNTMRAIFSIANQPSRANGVAAFEQMVWKFAPAAAVLIAFFAFALFNMDLIPDSEMIQSLFNGSNHNGISQLWTL